MADSKIDFEPIDFEESKSEKLYTPDLSERGVLSTLGRSAASGATAGFDDEIAALVMSASRMGDDREFWDIYRDIRDGLRLEKEEIARQSPVLSTVGELGGAIVTSALPLGLAAKGASLGQKVASMAKAGAATGALAGVGTGTADLTKGEVLPAVGEAAVGAGMGAAAGAGGQLVGSGLAKVGGELVDILKDTPFAQRMGEVVRRTMRGEELAGKVTQTSQETREGAEMLLGAFKQLESLTGREYGEAYDKLTKQGTKVNPQNLSKFIDDELAKAEAVGKDKGAIEEIRSTVKDILREREVELTPLPSPGISPKAAAQDKARTAAAQKVESKAATELKKDEVLLNQLLDRYDELRPGPGEEPSKEFLKILGRIATIKDRTPSEFNPLIETEALTGRTVHVAPRGIGTPIAAVEDLFENLPKPITETQRASSLTPEQTKTGLTALGDLFEQFKLSESSMGKRYAAKAKDALSMDKEAAIPAANAKEIQEASSRIGAVKGGLEALGETPDLKMTVDRIENMIRQSARPGTGGERDLNLALSSLESQFPREVEGLRQMVKEKATREDLARALSAQSAFGQSLSQSFRNLDILGGAGLGAQAIGLHAARVGAKAVKAGTEASKNIVKNTAKALYDMTPDQLEGLAQFALKKGGTAGQMTANTIRKALSEPMAKRRALLFTLMQQPQVRELVREENPFIEEEK